MTKDKIIAFKTMAMKARVYNYIRKTLYKKKLEEINIQEKEAIFNEIFSMNRATHWELKFYKGKREYKEHIYQERVKRGYKFKTKTPKPEIKN
jgi:hypothetical protein